MKAAVMYGPHDIRIEEVADPVIGKGEVLIKIKNVGICGGDIHFYNGTHPYSNYPRIYGHELSGDVVETFEEYPNVKIGDRVVLEPLIACGHCYPCRVGKYNCCENIKVIGAHVDGGFAEYIKVPYHRVHKIPDSLAYDLASLCEPYSIGAQCTKRGSITKEDTVLIMGSGAIGLTVLDFAKNIIGARVMICDIHPFRLELAKKFGADAVVNSKEEDIYKRIMEFTNHEGASVVVEATGVSSVMESTENLVAAGGTIVIVGLTNDKVAFTGINFTKKEMTIHGSRNSANLFPYVIDSISSGKLHSEELMTNKFKFEDIGEAFAYTAQNLDKVGKVVIEMY